MATPWIDFSHYGLKLFIGVIDPPAPPLPGRILVMAGQTHEHESRLEALGFMREPSSGHWVSFEQPVLGNFQREFPEAKIIEDADMRQFARRMSVPTPAPVTQTADEPAQTPPVLVSATPTEASEAPTAADVTPLEIKVGAPSQSAPADAAITAPAADFQLDGTLEPARKRHEAAPRVEPAARGGVRSPNLAQVNAEIAREEMGTEIVEQTIANARYLGLNRFGNKVMHGADGVRFIVTSDDKPKLTRESGVANQAGLFLRGVNPAQMDSAAEGFVEELARGSINRIDDLRRFTAAIYALDDIADTDDRLLEAHELVEAAIGRWLVKKNARSSRGMADVFHLATRFHDARPYLGDLSRLFPDARMPVPAAIGVVIQRAIGTEAEFQDKAVVISGDPGLAHFIPSKAKLKVFVDDQRQADIAGAVTSQAGVSHDGIIVGQPDYAGSDATIINDTPRYLPEPVDYNGGLKLTRADLADFIDSLEARAPLGRSIFVMRAESLGGFTAEEEAVREWIGARYAIEGCADIDGSLHVGRPDAPAMRVLVVGRERPAILEAAPEPAMRKTEVSTLPALWTWSTGLVYARAKIAEYHAELEAEPGAEPDETVEDREDNYFQSPYVSASAVGHSSTMVPRNLDGATRHALSRVAQVFGDIDTKVQNELGMTREQMASSFSPEQVDAIALYLYAAQRQRAFLLADQTGIGKGRTLAAIMRRAALNGQKVLFLTEKTINISDIWRDIKHIGAENDFSPLILNDGAEIVDETTGTVVMRSQKRDYTISRMLSNQWPEEHNLIIATYSQFNRPGFTRRRRRQTRPDQAAVAAENQNNNVANGANADGQENGAEQPGMPAGVIDPETQAAQAARREMLEALQMHSRNGTSPKSVWLRHAIDENTVVVLDESHNATSESNISHNIAFALRNCAGIVFSSATFAKKAKNMDIYKPLLPPDFVNTTNLGEVLKKGGDSMLETLSSMLVKDGVMVRREHDLSKCEFIVTTDKDNENRNRSHMDALAPILAEMAYLSGELDEIINDRNEAIARQAIQNMNVGEGEEVDERRMRNVLKSMQLSRMSISSPLYHLSRLFVCSLLIEKASQEAIKALKNNQKPVILVENTVHSVLQEMLESEEDGQEPIEPDFKSLLRRTLGQLARASKKTRAGRVSIDMAERTPQEMVIVSLLEATSAEMPRHLTKPTTEMTAEEMTAALTDAVVAAASTLAETGGHDEQMLENALSSTKHTIDFHADDEMFLNGVIENPMVLRPPTPALAFERILKMIDEMPNLPASAIDAVRDRIIEESRRLHEKGEIDGLWKVEEITGRTLEYRDGQVVRRAGNRKVDIKNRFNSGETDALIINTSGTTGIDLHAGRRFRDQRQRVLIELQAPADINKQIQAYGRVNRFDQVTGPIIISLMAGLPIELRLLAMRNAKLARLSANTTSNREHSAKIKNIPDMMNEVGDIVATRYAEFRPDLMRRLGFRVDRNLEREERIQEVENVLDEDNVDTQRSANELLSRIAMLPVAEQVQVFNELQAEYETALQELDAKGQNPLKSQVVEGVVHLRERTVFDGADVANPTSEFHRPVFLQNVVIERTIAPLKSEQVANEYERGLVTMGADGVAEYAERLERNRERMLQTYLPANMPLADALETGQPRIVTIMNDRIQRLTNALRVLRAGSSIMFTIDGVVETGVVTRVVPPDPRYMHLASSYSVQIAVPGWSRIQSLSLQALMSDEHFSISEGLNGDGADDILASFDTIADGTRLEKRAILSGNEWMAMTLSIQNKLGSMVGWEDEQGIRHRGVLVSKRHNTLDMVPVSIRNGAMALAAVNGHGEFTRKIPVYGNSELHPSGIVIRNSGNDGVIIDMPPRTSRKFSHLYENEAFNAYVERYADQRIRNRVRMAIPHQESLPVVEAMIEAGARLYISYTNRNMANGWMANNMAQENVEAEAVVAHAPNGRV